MLTQKFFVICLATFCTLATGLTTAQSAPVCARNVMEYNLTPRLAELQHYFGPATTTGYVNQTNGSYFEVDTRTRPDAFVFTFMTSGFLDLNLIKQTGVVMFCDDGNKLTVVGLDRNERMTLNNGTIILGGGVPKQTFREGPKPELLRRLESR